MTPPITNNNPHYQHRAGRHMDTQGPYAAPRAAVFAAVLFVVCVVLLIGCQLGMGVTPTPPPPSP